MSIAITLVTVCFRNPGELERTLESLNDLDDSLFEVIIVDGSPDDSCAAVAAKYPRFHHIQGPDTGKYHAMNKGAAAARGDSLLFMNSGDKLHSAIHLARIAKDYRYKLGNTLIYGDCFRVVDGKNIFVPAPAIAPETLRVGVLPSHQSILIPAAYQRLHPYDEAMHFASDTKFLKPAFRDLPYAHVDGAIGVFAYGGACTSPGPWRLLHKQYRELCEALELGGLERAATAGRLVRRKLVHMIAGDRALQKLQSLRLAKSVNATR